MHPSRFARSCPELWDFMSGHGLDKAEGDPLSALVRLSGTLYEYFQYVPGSTSAVSPLEHLLKSGKGVCQDYAHVMIIDCPFMGCTVPLRIGLFVRGGRCRPADSGSGRTCLGGVSAPGVGMVGFDPTRQLDCRPTARAGCVGPGTITTWPRLGGYSGGLGGYKAGG